MSGSPERRVRRTARIVLLGPDDEVLLFRYLAEGFYPFWILPGGECDPGEDFTEAARRELREETGIAADSDELGPKELGIVRQADYEYCGEPVRAIEHFFLHRSANRSIDTSGHTELERSAMREYRWFRHAELTDWQETIYPLDIADLVKRVGVLT